MTTILHILQIIGMYLLLSRIPFWLWNIMAIFFVILYLMGKSYYAVKEEDGENVARFWYTMRSFVFIIDIISVVILYSYIFLF